MAEIIVCEFMDEAALDPLKEDHLVTYDPQLVDEPGRLIDLVKDASALIVRNRTQVRGDLLSAASSLQCVGRLGVGLDNIDLEACKGRGIAVFPATGANDRSVSEYVIGTALSLRRTAFGSTERVVAGEWPRNELMGGEISGATLGLIGFGNIARDVAALARAFGMQILAFDPFLGDEHKAWNEARKSDLQTVLQESDVVSIHTPLTDGTRHLIDSKTLAMMKPDAILINAARGGVVDEATVCDALKAGQLGGAALDVFEAEPLTAETGQRFADVPNLILTPHIAGVTNEANVRVSHVTVANVLRHLQANQ